MTDCCLANPSALFKHSVSFRGPWLSVLLRLQIWPRPDRLISQKHRTAALKKQHLGNQRQTGGENTSKLHPGGKVVCPISLREHQEMRQQQSLVPKGTAQAVTCSPASALHSSSSSLGTPRCLSSSRCDSTHRAQPGTPGLPPGQAAHVPGRHSQPGRWQQQQLLHLCKAPNGSNLALLVTQAKPNERPNIAAFKRLQQINRATGSGNTADNSLNISALQAARKHGRCR